MAEKRPVLRVYGCGGMGVEFIRNRVLRMINSESATSTALAEIKPAMVDTSKANMAGAQESIEHYILRGADGSGKKRSTNYAALKDRANEILQAIPAGDYNVIIHSAGGGSGSVLGPILANELLSRDIPVIVFCVGSTGSDIEAENSYNTLVGYEQTASRIRKTPVPMVYFENDNGKTPAEIDETLSVYLPMLAGVFSGKNHGLDSMDIRNFLFYNRVSDFAPALTQLDLFSGEITLGQDESVLSLLTLVKQGVATPKDVLVRYQATGVMSEEFAKFSKANECLRLVMVANHFHGVIAGLRATRDRFAEAAAKTAQRKLVSEPVESEDDGLVL